MTDAAERLRLRYPSSRIPRPILVAIITVLALVALGWLIWAATVYATPAVAGQVTNFRAESDTRMAVTFTVDRRDPSVPVVCIIGAQAVDHEPVAEKRVEVGPRPERLVDVSIEVTTLRRAVTATVKNCTVKE